jgi:outer membrane biosynthesis protein TonB
MNSIAIQARNEQKGFTTSIVVHLLLLLMAFFYLFKTTLPDPDPNKPYKVALDFEMMQEIKHNPPKKFTDFDEESSNSTKANADKGESRPLNEEIQKVEQNDPKPPAPIEAKPTPVEAKPTPAPPAPTPAPPVVSSKAEDVPVKATETKTTTETTKKTETSSTPPKTAPTTTPSRTPTESKPAPNTTPAPKTGSGTVGSTTGTGTKPQSQTDGNGQGKSDSGPGRGSDRGTDVTSGTGNSSDGTGEFDGSGNGIFSRKVIYRNYGALPMTQSGTVIVKTCINREGSVTFAEILPGSTITDRNILKKTLQAAKGYRYAPDKTAPKEQCGKLTITLDINAFKLK